MGDEVRALVERLLPGRRVRTVVRLGGGLDHEAHEVDGELVVRRRRTGDPDERAAAVRREAALLEVVAGVSPLPVPEGVRSEERRVGREYCLRGEKYPIHTEQWTV